AGARELRAEVTADAARAHDDDVHGMMIHCAKNMSASLERRVAIDAARAAGHLLQSELQGSRHITYKGSPTNLVTEMDARAEELIVARLLSAFPEDGILAEERGAGVGARAGAGSSTRSTARPTTPTVCRSSACRSASRLIGRC